LRLFEEDSTTIANLVFLWLGNLMLKNGKSCICFLSYYFTNLRFF